MFNIPQLSYIKPFNKKLRYIKSKKNNFKFNQYAIYAQNAGYLYIKQIEACRKVLRRKLGKKSKIKIHLYPNMPYSSKPKETRMGRGKGANFKWLTHIAPGSLLFSVTESDSKNIYETIRTIKYKLPVNIKLMSRKTNKIISKLKNNSTNTFIYI